MFHRNVKKLKKIWKIISFCARIVNTIEDVYQDIKCTFFDSENKDK